MDHRFEAASSGRSTCRGCGRNIQRGELRFGECLENPFADGKEMTIWFHPACAAYKRPESFLQALGMTIEQVPDRASLERAAHDGLTHPRLQRIDGAGRAPSTQATCRHCRNAIERGTWRIRLAFFEEGRFSAGGFVHLDCRKAYFETEDILDRVLQFSSALSADERADLQSACDANR
jgi:hypothetical protein